MGIITVAMTTTKFMTSSRENLENFPNRVTPTSLSPSSSPGYKPKLNYAGEKHLPILLGIQLHVHILLFTLGALVLLILLWYVEIIAYPLQDSLQITDLQLLNYANYHNAFLNNRKLSLHAWSKASWITFSILLKVTACLCYQRRFSRPWRVRVRLSDVI